MSLLTSNTKLVVMLVSVLVSITGFFALEIYRERKKYQEAKPNNE